MNIKPKELSTLHVFILKSIPADDVMFAYINWYIKVEFII